MSVPNNELIAEVLLFAEGFRDAKSLGPKLVAIFVLSRYNESFLPVLPRNFLVPFLFSTMIQPIYRSVKIKAQFRVVRAA